MTPIWITPDYSTKAGDVRISRRKLCRISLMGFCLAMHCKPDMDWVTEWIKSAEKAKMGKCRIYIRANWVVPTNPRLGGKRNGHGRNYRFSYGRWEHLERMMIQILSYIYQFRSWLSNKTTFAQSWQIPRKDAQAYLLRWKHAFLGKMGFPKKITFGSLTLLMTHGERNTSHHKHSQEQQGIMTDWCPAALRFAFLAPPTTGSCTGNCRTSNSANITARYNAQWACRFLYHVFLAHRYRIKLYDEGQVFWLAKEAR